MHVCFCFSLLDYIHTHIVMSSKVCKCGGTEIDTDRPRGVSICMKCGDVIEDTFIVNEAELTETSGGGIQVVGHWLSNDDVRSATTSGIMGFNIRESRQITLQKARRGIMDIASNMRMNHHCVDAAFKVCLQKTEFSWKEIFFLI
jgi:transcription initiation factor TFIIIB Brf1 subunit/transcription initiation factor TFIIB